MLLTGSFSLSVPLEWQKKFKKSKALLLRNLLWKTWHVSEPDGQISRRRLAVLAPRALPELRKPQRAQHQSQPHTVLQQHPQPHVPRGAAMFGALFSAGRDARN